MNKDETRQNYLEAIYFISLKNHDVRAIDIVEYLNFSRPTVSIALKQLASEDYITITNNKIKLTEKGFFIYAYEYIIPHASLRQYWRIKPLSEKCKEKAGVFKLILCFVQKGAPPSGGTHSAKHNRLWSEGLRVR